MTQFSNAESMATVRTKINAAIAQVDIDRDQTGWTDTVDTVLTDIAPLMVTADTPAQVTNNGGTIENQEIPSDYAAGGMVVSSAIQGFAGDALMISPEFNVVRSTGSGTYNLKIWFDIGGGVPALYVRTITLAGTSVQHVSLTQLVYCKDTWETNGGKLMVESSVDTEIYDVRFIIAREHKGRGTYP